MISRFKQSVICKSITKFEVNKLITNSYIPKAGDVAFFKVLELGKHTRIQLTDCKNHHILPNDILMATFGNRYATAQLEGKVPNSICEEYHILGQGGVVGIMNSIHKKYEHKGPTRVQLIGYATINNKVINTKYYNTSEIDFAGVKPNDSEIILSIGGAMDSGKTTTAGYLCRGYSKAGYKVAYIKLTGTVYTKDADFVADCGAHYTTDFSKLGFPSTYLCSLQELLNLHQGLLEDVFKNGQPQKIVIEIADGLIQRETAMLLQSTKFMNTVDRVIYSDSSSTGILQGLQMLYDWKIKPFALCGSFTASPMLIDEVESMTDIPVVTLEDLTTKTNWIYDKKVLANDNNLALAV